MKQITPTKKLLMKYQKYDKIQLSRILQEYRKLRINSKVKLSEVAKRSRISVSTLSGIEGGSVFCSYKKVATIVATIDSLIRDIERSEKVASDSVRK